MNLLLTKTTFSSVFASKLVTTVSMSVVFVLIGGFLQIVIARAEGLGIPYGVLSAGSESHLAYVLVCEFLPLMLILSTIGVVISAFFDPSSGIYFFALVLLLLFGALRLSLTWDPWIFAGSPWWMPVGLWLLWLFILGVSVKFIDAETLLID